MSEAANVPGDMIVFRRAREVSTGELRDRMRNNVLWDSVGYRLMEGGDELELTEGGNAVHELNALSAVQLQLILDDECGSWANSFG